MCSTVEKRTSSNSIMQLTAIVGALVGIAVSSYQIYLGAAAIGKCDIEPMIPVWLLGEWEM